MRLHRFLSSLLIVCMLLVLTGCANASDSITTTEDLYMNALHKSDPAEDDTLNILMTAASFSHYYTDELAGIFAAAGIKARVSNLMKSSTGINLFYEHWKNNEAVFQLITYDENGKTVLENVRLEDALTSYNWDVISLQDGSSNFRKKQPEEVLAGNREAQGALVDFFRQQLPGAQVYTQQIWAYDIGFNKDDYKVDSKEEQDAFAERVRKYTEMACKEFDLKCVYSGEAWIIARRSPLVGNLCARLSKNNGEGDYYHDGDIGGGQYLNACVWFETLTGQSCIGNTYRPDYALSEELIAVLQQAAHEAVNNMRTQ